MASRTTRPARVSMHADGDRSMDRDIDTKRVHTAPGDRVQVVATVRDIRQTRPLVPDARAAILE